MLPFCSKTGINQERLLTTDKGYVIEPIPPLLTDFNRLLLLRFCLGGHTKVVRMFDYTPHILWFESVQDIEKVGAVG